MNIRVFVKEDEWYPVHTIIHEEEDINDRGYCIEDLENDDDAKTITKDLYDRYKANLKEFHEIQEEIRRNAK